MAPIDYSRVPVFYHNYLNQVTAQTLEEGFRLHCSDLVNLLKGLSPDKWEYRYSPEKWSVKELVQHIIDAERIFCYRSLRFSRKDSTPLSGFDENLYTQNAKATRRTPESFIEELEAVQRASALFFLSLDDEQLEESGIANGNSIYVKAIGFIVLGHTLHHKRILLERYLK